MLVTDLYQIFGTYALFGDVAATLVSGMLLKKSCQRKLFGKRPNVVVAGLLRAAGAALLAVSGASQA